MAFFQSYNISYTKELQNVYLLRPGMGTEYCDQFNCLSAGIRDLSLELLD